MVRPVADRTGAAGRGQPVYVSARAGSAAQRAYPAFLCRALVCSDALSGGAVRVLVCARTGVGGMAFGNRRIALCHRRILRQYGLAAATGARDLGAGRISFSLAISAGAFAAEERGLGRRAAGNRMALRPS